MNESNEEDMNNLQNIEDDVVQWRNKGDAFCVKRYNEDDKEYNMGSNEHLLR